jgi:hypothetical protein
MTRAQALRHVTGYRTDRPPLALLAFAAALVAACVGWLR